MDLSKALTLLPFVALCCAGCDGLVGLDAPEQGDAGCAGAMTVCGGGCSDLMTDGHNCGGCGNSCLGATCAAGLCRPEVFAAGSPASLALDDASVYWTDTASGRVMRCALGGCPDGGEVLFDLGDAGAGQGAIGDKERRGFGGLAVNEGEVFFSDNEPELFADSGLPGSQATVYACPATGCGSTPRVLVTEQGTASGLATDGASVYWMQSLDRSVHACPVQGCSGAPTVLAPGFVNPTPWGLAMDGTSIYFATDGNGVGWCPYGACDCLLSLGGACSLDPFHVYPASNFITAGPSGIYWTTGDRVMRSQPNFADVTMTTDTVLALAQSPGPLALDDVNVYFAAQDRGGAVYRCTLGGCSEAPVAVSTGFGAIGDIKLDAQRIFAVVGVQTDSSVITLSPPVGDAIVWVAK